VWGVDVSLLVAVKRCRFQRAAWTAPGRGSAPSAGWEPTGSPGLQGHLVRAPCTGTGTRYLPDRLSTSFVLLPHTNWPTGPGGLLLEFGQRPSAPAPHRRPQARAACGAIGGGVLRGGATGWFIVIHSHSPQMPSGHGLCQWPGSEAAYVAVKIIFFFSFCFRLAPCDPSGRHRAWHTTGSGGPSTNSPVPVPVPVQRPRRELGGGLGTAFYKADLK
jgi:hypothetical protein